VNAAKSTKGGKRNFAADRAEVRYAGLCCRSIAEL